MKLLHCIPSLHPSAGGTAAWVEEFCRHSAHFQHCSQVATLDRPEILAGQARPYKVYALGGSRSHYGFSLRFSHWLKWNHGHYDALLVHGLWQYHSLAVWRALRHTRTRYFLYPHGMLDPWFRRRYPLKHLKKWLYWTWAEHRVLRDAEAVLFASEEERTLARQSFSRYRCCEQVAPLGITPPVGDSEAQKAHFRARFPALAGRPFVLFLGRIVPKKGCDLLLRAFHQWRRHPQSPPDFCLVLGGPEEAGWAQELKRMICQSGLQSEVIWTGPLAGDLKWGALRSAALLALPSHQENFGMVVVEALACGVPVLLSTQVNIWREIVEDRAGLAGPDTEDGVLALLHQWGRLSSTEQAQMGDRALACYQARYEIRQALRRTFAILEQPHSARILYSNRKPLGKGRNLSAP